MIRNILLFTAILLTLIVFRPNPEIKIGGYPALEAELVASLEAHQAFIEPLQGSREFNLYKQRFNYRANQMIAWLQYNDLVFKEGSPKNSVMSVRHDSSNPIPIVYVHPEYVKDLQNMGPSMQAIVLHELSHIVFWSEDTDERLENVPVEELTEYADWWNLIVLFKHDQNYLKKIVVRPNSG